MHQCLLVLIQHTKIFPTKKLVKVPDGIELENVATLMTKGLTVFIFYIKHIL